LFSLFCTILVNTVYLHILCYPDAFLQNFKGKLFSELLQSFLILDLLLFLEGYFYHLLLEGLCIFLQSFLSIDWHFGRMMQKKIFFFVEEGNIAADSYLPLIFDANIFLFAFISGFVKQQPGIGLVKFSQFLLIPKQYHYSFESFSLFFVFHF
jgi:hypothetical protein